MERPMMAPPASLRILIVDDEPDVREAVASLFETFLEDVTVHQASSGGEGLRLLRNEQVDVIVSDFKMPGMDGVQFLTQAEKLYPGMPRVLVTAFDREAVLSLGAEAGIPIVHKPFEPTQLLSALDDVLAAA
jgi:two-component system response regulator FlrC